MIEQDNGSTAEVLAAEGRTRLSLRVRDIYMAEDAEIDLLPPQARQLAQELIEAADKLEKT